MQDGFQTTSKLAQVLLVSKMRSARSFEKMLMHGSGLIYRGAACLCLVVVDSLGTLEKHM